MPRPESPEEAPERTLIELRGEGRPIEAEPDSTRERDLGPDPSVTPTPRPDAPGRTGGGAPLPPSYTPYEVAPVIANRLEVERGLAAEYPPVLRDEGVAGITLVHMFFGAAGVLESALVTENSGYEQLGRAAIRVSDAFDYVPALNGGEAVAVWIHVPIIFQMFG